MGTSWNRQLRSDNLGTSLPEVVDVKENADGTTALTIEAVCLGSGNDCALHHTLKVRFRQNGTFQYLGNEIRVRNWGGFLLISTD